MTPSLCFFGFSGAIIAYYSGVLYQLIELSLPEDLTSSQINVKTTYVFIALGLSETITGFASGYLADRLEINFLA